MAYFKKIVQKVSSENRAMRRSAWAGVLCFLWLSGTLPGVAADNQLQFTVTAKSGLNLREDKSSKAKVIKTIPFGETVTLAGVRGEREKIAGKVGHWMNVQWGDDSGWAFSAFLRKKSNPQFRYRLADDIVQQSMFAKGEKGEFCVGPSKYDDIVSSKKILKFMAPMPPITEIQFVLDGLQNPLEMKEGHCILVTFQIKNIIWKETGSEKSGTLHKTVKILGSILSVELTKQE